MHVYHWHREGIHLPGGVETLASSEYYPNQAFRITEKALGTQFHPEITDAMIRLWSAHAPADRDKEPGAQPRETHLGAYLQHQARVQQWAMSMLDRLGFEAQSVA
jgi:GMP synthase (glutamine-hydrolysing)